MLLDLIVIILFAVLIKSMIDVNMNNSEPKRKKTKHNLKNDENKGTTVVNRSLISPNWQNLLKAMSSDKSEAPETPETADSNQNNHYNIYTGSFRRDRKKEKVLNCKERSETNSSTVGSNMQNLNINCHQGNNENHTDYGVWKNPKPEPSVASVDKKITKYLAMDCEMVGIGTNGQDNMLARVSIVNKFGDCIYDKFVKARESVVDYRTDISGVRKEDMLNGEEFDSVQKEVSDLIKGKILVGHALKNDLDVLLLSHPKKNIRDTARYKPFRKITNGSTPSLKRLTQELLGVVIQSGEHCPAEDARAAMQLYRGHSQAWENSIREKRFKKD